MKGEEKMTYKTAMQATLVLVGYFGFAAYALATISS
tara:strand:- start:329 stop:436 length:108 start_codon:yes stop_codon:yes gene_type:complete